MFTSHDACINISTQRLNQTLTPSFINKYFPLPCTVEGPRAARVKLLNITQCPAYPYAPIQESKNCLKR